MRMMKQVSFVLVVMLILCPMADAATTQPALPPAPQGVTIKQNLSYLAADREERLDLYLPSTRPPGMRSPAVVIIHGGGWTGGDKAADREFNIGATLALHGYVAASINYKLGKHVWPQNLLDCKNGVRHLRAHAEEYSIDPDRIAVIGGSAGGHLALMVAYTSDVAELEPKDNLYPNATDDVRCVIDLYGITNLITRRKTDAHGNPTGPTSQSSSLLPDSPTTNLKAWQLASPVYHVSAQTPPTLILQGTADTTVDRDQSTELAAKLQSCGVSHELLTIEGVGHTFDLQTWNHKPLPRDLRPVVLKFLDQYLPQR
jgi:acetyl esterase/lipase